MRFSPFLNEMKGMTLGFRVHMNATRHVELTPRERMHPKHELIDPNQIERLSGLPPSTTPEELISLIP